MGGINTNGIIKKFGEHSKRCFVNSLDNSTICANTNSIGKSYLVKNRFSLIPENSKLFSWSCTKPELNLEKFDPESLVLVHRTSYYPDNGKILATICSPDSSYRSYRTTVHFSLNQPVVEHMFGNNWNDTEYSCLLPFKETIEKIPQSNVIGGMREDFMFLNEVNLPKGSVILKQSPNIPKGYLKVSEIFDEKIKLVETSNKDMVKTTNLLIKKMGYSNYDSILQKYLKLNKKQGSELCSVPDLQNITNLTMIEENGGIKSTQEYYKKHFLTNKVLDEKDKNLKKTLELSILIYSVKDKFSKIFSSWNIFCKKHGFYDGAHDGSPWRKLECFLAQFGYSKEHGLDNKESLIKELKNIEAELPKGKSLGLDVNEVINIIGNSKSYIDVDGKLQLLKTKMK